jgi:hypothetical protein
MLDKRTVTLNHGKKEVNVMVYLKEVNVKGSSTKIKAYCRIIG